MGTVCTDPPRGRQIGFEQLVQLADPRPPYDVVYDARREHERSFIEYDGETNPHRDQPGE